VAELKTKKSRVSVKAFLDAITDQRRRADCRTLAAMMTKASGRRPAMWGDRIVGFGDYHYRYASGREGDWFVLGFSPRKQALTLYIAPGLDRHKGLLARLGSYTRGAGCLYIKHLADVDVDVLRELFDRAVAERHEGS
jgi:hypothetical protein